MFKILIFKKFACTKQTVNEVYFYMNQQISIEKNSKRNNRNKKIVKGKIGIKK